MKREVLSDTDRGRLLLLVPVHCRVCGLGAWGLEGAGFRVWRYPFPDSIYRPWFKQQLCPPSCHDDDIEFQLYLGWTRGLHWGIERRFHRRMTRFPTLAAIQRNRSCSHRIILNTAALNPHPRSTLKPLSQRLHVTI